MPLLSETLNTIAERENALSSTLGSLYLEGMVLDAASLKVWQCWVEGELSLEELGSLFDDVIYADCPEARIDPPIAF